MLDCFINIAPSPRPVSAVERVVPIGRDAFSFVFRSIPSWTLTISYIAREDLFGRFERMPTNISFGKMMRFSSPTAFMAQKKEVVDEAFAGDIIDFA